MNRVYLKVSELVEIKLRKAQIQAQELVFVAT